MLTTPLMTLNRMMTLYPMTLNPTLMTLNPTLMTPNPTLMTPNLTWMTPNRMMTLNPTLMTPNPTWMTLNRMMLAAVRPASGRVTMAAAQVLNHPSVCLSFG